MFPSRAIIRCLYGNLRQEYSKQTGDIKERAIRTPPYTPKGGQ